VFSKRESKRRAILRLLDRIALRPLQARTARTAGTNSKRGQSNLMELDPLNRGQTTIP
jgi:hypothetical protein